MSAILEASGTLTGPISLPSAVQLGPVSIWASDTGVKQFRAEFDVSSMDDASRDASALRVPAAIAAGVAAASGAGVQVQLLGTSYPLSAGRSRVASHANGTYEVQVPVDDAAAGAETVLEVFKGEDRRLAALYEVYLLGLQAVQTIAPVVGFWAFSNVLEEESKGHNNLKGVRNLLDGMAHHGYPIPRWPQRKLDDIRAAAVHPTPDLPLPTVAEVEWFRMVALLCLRRRVARSLGRRR